MSVEESKLPQRLINVQPPSDAAWKRFTAELAVALEALEEDEFLIVLVKHTNRFVQFVAQGSFGMRAEVCSDFYLPEDQHLSSEQYATLLEMGWNAPTNLPNQFELGGHPPDGSPNYFLDVAPPVSFGLLADLATATCQTVYGAGHPGNLEYEAAGEGKVSIRFPNLGIRRRQASVSAR